MRFRFFLINTSSDVGRLKIFQSRTQVLSLSPPWKDISDNQRNIPVSLGFDTSKPIVSANHA